VALKGNFLSPDLEANTSYYGRGLTAKEILFGNAVKPTEAAVDLAGKLGAYSEKP
jgi:lipid-binding SYLF domain-containing protein